MQTIIAKKSIKKELLMFVGCMAFVAMGCFLLNTSDDAVARIISWLAIAFFGLGAVIMAVIDIKTYGKPQLVITDNAISYLTFRGYKDIKLDTVKYYHVMNKDMIGFYAETPKNVLSPSLGAVPVSNLDVKADYLLKILVERVERYGAKPLC